jgi:hypothetical protein
MNFTENEYQGQEGMQNIEEHILTIEGLCLLLKNTTEYAYAF